MNPKTGQRERVQDVPILPYFPPEADKGLWGGEGWISGFRYANNDKLSARVKKTWKPQLFDRELYSEILDKKFNITVTIRTLDLIDAAYGFDFYILKTPKEDLNSKLGMDLKRAMLLRLAKRDSNLHPDDPAKREQIYDRYKDFNPTISSKDEALGTLKSPLVENDLPDSPAGLVHTDKTHKEFVIPYEEAEWVGLTLEEAVEKQRLLEKKDPVPLFKVYAEELAQQLQSQELTEPLVVEQKH
ncbi:hypothetical protein NDU88_002527 [Pleurodeles waltl]|uniref:Large ribosomal subunit protein bL28m n=2 Tax=Pleurodeles waltl TaxID=8319 RepID=A0AAV7M8F8_PLEWA|nr:hypothetical protein NDU88_002527 [Pleurodeles waltl]